MLSHLAGRDHNIQLCPPPMNILGTLTTNIRYQSSLVEYLWSPAFPGSSNGGRLLDGKTPRILVILQQALNAFMDTWAYLSMYIQGLKSYLKITCTFTYI